jgi:hypothetical protein
MNWKTLLFSTLIAFAISSCNYVFYLETRSGMGLNDNIRYNQLIKSVEKRRLVKSYKHLDWLQKNCTRLATKGFHEQIVDKYAYDGDYIRDLLKAIHSGPNTRLKDLSEPAFLYVKSQETRDMDLKESLIFQSVNLLKTSPVEALAAHYLLLQLSDVESRQEKLKLLLETEQVLQRQIKAEGQRSLDNREYELQLTLAKCYEMLFYHTKKETMADLAIEAVENSGSSFMAIKKSKLLSDNALDELEPDEFIERLKNRKSLVNRAD